MPFPVQPDLRKNEDLFLIQDPFGIGRIVLPIWDLAPNGRFVGLGSAFRTDKTGTMLTAYHVLEQTLQFDQNFSQRPVPKVGANPLILEIGGMALGAAPILDKNWLPLRKYWTIIAPQKDPFIDTEPKNILELIALHVPSNIFDAESHQFFTVTKRQVAVGEKLLAIGYADMKVDEPTSMQTSYRISGYLYGSFRRVTEFRPCSLQSTRPWPIYVMDGDWPSGMSGGPVLDESGCVVGLVSTGSPLGNYATARSFYGDENLLTDNQI